MSLNEKSIFAVNEYFVEFAQNAINIAYGESDEDTTFAEFMENVTNYLHLLTAEHVATEVLELSSRTIEKYNDGRGLTVDDVQELIEEKEDGDESGDSDDDDEEIY